VTGISTDAGTDEKYFGKYFACLRGSVTFVTPNDEESGEFFE
jgi:hypothetical protein